MPKDREVRVLGLLMWMSIVGMVACAIAALAALGFAAYVFYLGAASL